MDGKSLALRRAAGPVGGPRGPKGAKANFRHTWNEGEEGGRHAGGEDDDEADADGDLEGGEDVDDVQS